MHRHNVLDMIDLPSFSFLLPPRFYSVNNHNHYSLLICAKKSAYLLFYSIFCCYKKIHKFSNFQRKYIYLAQNSGEYRMHNVLYFGIHKCNQGKKRQWDRLTLYNNPFSWKLTCPTRCESIPF